MWKQTNKLTFWAGIGMGMLIFFWATNLKHINVINGDEKGTPLKYITDIPESYASKLKRHEVFLDNTTGDFFSYIQSTSQRLNLDATEEK